MKLIKKNMKKFSNECRGHLAYWKSISHAEELLNEYKFLFKKHINKTSKVIDIGAGRLFYKKIIQRYTDNYKSLDFKKTHPEIDFVGTTSSTKQKNNSYDVIFCSQVLEHVPDPKESLKEFHRILRKGGIAIISTPFLMYLHNEPHDHLRYTKHYLKKISKDSEFEILKIKEVGGLMGFFGIIIQNILIGLTWHIPIINKVAIYINRFIQVALSKVDKIIGAKKIFPSNYLTVLKK